MNVELYRRLDILMASKHAGTTAEISKKLDISRRLVKYMIERMKVKFDCPIAYCKNRKTYYYTVKGNCSFKFEACKVTQIKENLDVLVKHILC